MTTANPRISNPPKVSPNFTRVVDRVADQITTQFTQTNYGNVQLLTFGISLLDIKDPEDNQDPNNVELMRIAASRADIKENIVKLLNLWVTRRNDPNWENVIAALRCISLGNLAGELNDELNSGYQSPHKIKEPSIQDQTDGEQPVQQKPMTDEQLKSLFGDMKITKGVNDLKQMEIQVLIQTVNPKEFNAVMIQLKDDVSEYRVNDPNEKEKFRSYYVGKLNKSSIPVAIVQTEMGSDGEYGSRNETKVALHWLPNLRYIFAVGVCAGIKGKELKLGKVVISKAIQDYSHIKDEEDRLIIRSPCWDCKDGNFYNFISRAPKLPVNAVCGVVLSANTLIKNDDTRKKLLQACPEAIAFEMEGHGIAGACREKRIEILIVKGVSDFGDKNKSDIWQPQAAVNAATVLCEVMGKYDAFDSTDTQTVDGEKQATKVIEETQEGEINGKTMLKGDVQSKKRYLHKRVYENLSKLYAKLILDLKEVFRKKKHCVSNIKTALLAADRHNVTYFASSDFQSKITIDEIFYCFANDCKYFSYTILKTFVDASNSKTAKKLMDRYIKEVDKTLITGLDLHREYKNVQIGKSKYEKNTRKFTVVCRKEELLFEELNFIVKTLEDCLKLRRGSISVEDVIHNCFILVCRISLNAKLPHKISSSKLNSLSEKGVELIVDDDKMELKIPLDCDTEHDIVWTEHIRVTTDAVKETSTKSDYHVDIPEKAKMLTLSEPEPEESYDEANVEMKPLALNETEDDTDISSAQFAAKQKDDVEIKSPVSASAEESIVMSFPTPAQETSALIHKQSMVAPPIKSHCRHFETVPVEVFQEYVSYFIRPHTAPLGHSGSASTSLSILVPAYA